ncbi:MAG: hypothetical protein RIG27_12985 [Coleofasciculus sp. F4-SAH-05]
MHQVTPGESPIARYFVPVLPLLFIGIAYAFSLSRFTELIFGVFLAYSLIIGIIIFDTRCNVVSCHSWIVERLEQWTGKGLLFRISYLETHELVGTVIFIFLIFTIAVNQLLIDNKKIGLKQ